MAGDALREAHGRVVVVDDGAAMVDRISEALAEHGITATGCTVVEAASAVVRRLAPQLVILDIVMPRTNGFEILHQLRLDPRTAKLPVLTMAGVTALPADLAADGQGAVELLRKPFDLEVLLEETRTKWGLMRSLRVCHGGSDSVPLRRGCGPEQSVSTAAWCQPPFCPGLLIERLACTHVLDLNTFDNKLSLLPLWIEGNQHVSPIDQIGAALKLSLSFDAP